MHYHRWQRHGDPTVTASQDGRYERHRSVADRFWALVARGDGCWTWTGHSTRGYGVFAMNRRKARAHRVAYELEIGPIPAALTIDHLCRNTLCVRPDHLEPVTARVNILRSGGLAAQELSRTQCPSGHSYAGSNLFRGSKGERMCLLCRGRRGAPELHRAAL